MRDQSAFGRTGIPNPLGRKFDMTLSSMKFYKAAYERLAEQAAGHGLPTSVFIRTILMDAAMGTVRRIHLIGDEKSSEKVAEPLE